MNSIHRTAILVIGAVASAATVRIRAADHVCDEMSAPLPTATASAPKLSDVIFRLDDEAKLVARALTTNRPIAVGQVQQTKLKKVSREKAIIIAAVAVAAAVLIALTIAATGVLTAPRR